MAIWRTPHGREVRMDFRPDTNDYGVIDSILRHDEYGIPEGISGVAIDIGAHIGAWTVGVAIDNPDLRMIAIEPVPDNFRLLVRNVTQNGLAGRVTVVNGAATRGKTATIRHNFRGADDGDVHRHVGNQRMAPGVEHDELVVEGFTLRQLAKGPIRLVKIDCEGCEYDVLAASLRGVEEIVGEYHDGRDRLLALLAKTHTVSTTGDATFGNFRAVQA